jgi:Flp pilus assembly protein TadB
MVVYFVFPKAMHFIETQEDPDEGNAGSRRRFFLACACVILSVLVGSLLGFLFVVPTAFLSYGFLLGDRKHLVALIIVTVVTTALFYVGFDYFLNIPMLRGVLRYF